MTRSAWAALGALALILAAVIAAEWQGSATLSEADATGIRPSLRLPAFATAAVPSVVEDRTDGWLATSLARPLFTRDRRPVGAHTATVASGPAALPRLTGIAVSPLGRHAIFAGDNGKPLVVGEGGSVGPYTVRTIQPNVVQMEGPEGKKSVSPAFDRNRIQSTESQGVPGLPGLPNNGQPTIPGFPNGLPPGFPFPQQGRPPGLPALQPGVRQRFGDGAAYIPSPAEHPVQVATSR